VTRADLAAQLLVLLEQVVDERVDQRLADLGVTSTEFCSAGPLPPNTNARTFCRWCRSGRVHGAEHDAAGWRCSRSAWRAARSAGPKGTTAAKPANDDARALLAAAGLRPTRGGSR